MDNKQAITNLQSLLNMCISRGGIVADAATVITMQASIDFLTEKPTTNGE